MRKHRVFVLGVVLIMAPGSLTAQACRGTPLVAASAAVGGSIGFVPEATSQWGVGTAYRFNAPIAVAGSVTRTSFAAAEVRSSALRMEIAYDGLSTRRGEARFSLCPVAGVGRERYSKVSVITMPVGVAGGVEVPMGPVTGIVHVEPRFVYTHASIDGLARSATSPAFRGGAAVAVGPVFLGAVHEWVKGDGANHSTQLQLGATFGGSED